MVFAFFISYKIIHEKPAYSNMYNIRTSSRYLGSHACKNYFHKILCRSRKVEKESM